MNLEVEVGPFAYVMENAHLHFWPLGVILPGPIDSCLDLLPEVSIMTSHVSPPERQRPVDARVIYAVETGEGGLIPHEVLHVS
jgi:hypothetical protein